MAIDPFLLATIVGGIGSLLRGKAQQKRVVAQQDLEEKQYQDQVAVYLKEQEDAENKRQERNRLVTTFAKANGLDSALTPEVMEMLFKRRSPVAPPPYRKGGTPGAGWDLAGMAVDAAGSIYGAAKAPKLKKKTFSGQSMAPIDLKSFSSMSNW